MKSIDQRITERDEAQRKQAAEKSILLQKNREVVEFHSINFEQSIIFEDAKLTRRPDVISLTRRGGDHLNIKVLSDTKFLIRHDASMDFDAMSFSGEPVSEDAMLDTVIAFLER